MISWSELRPLKLSAASTCSELLAHAAWPFAALNAVDLRIQLRVIGVLHQKGRHGGWQGSSGPDRLLAAQDCLQHGQAPGSKRELTAR